MCARLGISLDPQGTDWHLLWLASAALVLPLPWAWQEVRSDDPGALALKKKGECTLPLRVRHELTKQTVRFPPPSSFFYDCTHPSLPLHCLMSVLILLPPSIV
ncbi:hypothetical protein T492DRAFT_499924 [Pavlovales sp. CCMP2436]|nr:hypothetical protein T492DRAFT_499924 [Pavlovales sp. CCMP2436]